MRCHRLALLPLVCLVLCAQDATRLKDAVTYLSSRELLGRETGQPGCVKAATWLAGQFQAIGLGTVTGSGMGGETPYHYLWNYSGFAAAPAQLQLGATTLDAGVHFRAEGPMAPGAAVDLGYGLPSDFRGADLRGRWAVVLEGHPGWEVAEAYRSEASLDAKLQAAASAGALGVILLEARHDGDPGAEHWNRVTPYRLASPGASLPLVRIHPEGGRLLDRDLRVLHAERGGRTHAMGRVAMTEERATSSLASQAANLVGVVRGTDPTLKDQYILITAHYDHIGGSGTTYYPGADDNASGTAGLVELARLVVGSQPKRSLLFVAMSGEEKGLLGSAAFAANPPVPLASIVAEVNLDMISRNGARTLYLTPAAVSGQVTTLVTKARELAVGKDLDLNKGIDQYWQQSDHYSFAKRGIPSIFFNTGSTADLHRTTDTVDKCDFPKMAKVVDLVRDFVLTWANTTDKPAAVSATTYNAWSWPVKGSATTTPLAILTQPQNQKLVAGGTATFTVAATGGKSPYTYQWYRNDAAVSGATVATYSFVMQASDASARFKATVKDAAGASLTSQEATIVVGTESSEKLVNGGFEVGTTPWTGTTTVIGNWSTATRPQPAFEGTRCARFGAKGSSVSQTLSQSVVIPPTVTSATLSLQLHIDTAETEKVVYDTLAVQIRNSAGAVLKTLATYSNVNAAAGYQPRTFDLTAYKGQTIQVAFVAKEDANLQTSFAVDAVSVTVK